MLNVPVLWSSARAIHMTEGWVEGKVGAISRIQHKNT